MDTGDGEGAGTGTGDGGGRWIRLLKVPRWVGVGDYNSSLDLNEHLNLHSPLGLPEGIS